MLAPESDAWLLPSESGMVPCVRFRRLSDTDSYAPESKTIVYASESDTYESLFESSGRLSVDPFVPPKIRVAPSKLVALVATMFRFRWVEHSFKSTVKRSAFYFITP